MHEFVVTGSSSGIGAAMVAHLRTQGRAVLGVAHDAADVVGDLACPAGRNSVIARVLERSAGALDGLVCAAGQLSNTDLAGIVSVNYFGTVACLDGWLDALQRRRGAAATVLASTGAAQVVEPEAHPLVQAMLEGDEERARREALVAGHGLLVYCLSKFALVCALRERSLRWAAAGVRINAVAPGPIETPMLRTLEQDPTIPEAERRFVPPVGRTGRPEEVAGLLGYLHSPAAGFIHGTVVFIDGGIDALTRPRRF